jgi:hypothetical protein
MSKKSPKKKSKSLFHKLAHIHLRAASFLLIFYLILGMLVDPRFLAYDFRQKYSAIASSSAITVSMRVMGEPEKPVLTAEAGWENDLNFIDLAWNQTEDATSFDLYRDSLPLITGLTQTTYRDENIEINTFYDYKVLARGSAGETFSDEIHIFSDDHEASEMPDCQITALDNLSFTNAIQTTNLAPVFSGTTNLENALIQIELVGPSMLIATTSANSNGYWSWSALENLAIGTYTISVTATDPENSLISAQISNSFEIVVSASPAEEDVNHHSNNQTGSKKTSSGTAIVPQVITTVPSENPPSAEPNETSTISVKNLFAIFVSVTNPDKLVYADDDLIVSTKVATVDPNFENNPIELRYTVLNEKNDPLINFSEKTVLPKNKTIGRNIHISHLVPTGKYRIVVSASDQNLTVAGEDFFQIQEYYLLSIGNLQITLSQIMQSLSWIILALICLLLFFLFLLNMEKYFISHAQRQITEKFLSTKGYFGNRKGVQR